MLVVSVCLARWHGAKWLSCEQTLSEATQQLPDTLKAGYPDVPWREISGFRNILVHNYLGDIDPDTVAAVVDKHLEPLARAVGAMLHKS